MDPQGSGRTVSVKPAQAAPLYQAATRQHRKLKTVLARWSACQRTALAQWPSTPRRPADLNARLSGNTLFLSKGHPSKPYPKSRESLRPNAGSV